MQVKFQNTEIPIQHLKLGTVVQSTDYGEPFGHIVGFYKIQKDSVVLWVQFESHDDAHGNPLKVTAPASLLNLVGH